MHQTDGLEVPATGDLEIDLSIRLTAASNTTLGARIGGAPVVYKPRAGERPLADFPTGTLANREVAAYRIATIGGWDVVPPTALRDGPLGIGSAQRWVEHTEESAAGDAALRLLRPDQVPPGWIPVLQAETGDGEPVLISHPDDPVLRSVAVLDEVLNNADRKGSHLLRSIDGRWWAIDNGLGLHHEDKLRTVLWGWSGDPLTSQDQQRLERLTGLADDPVLSDLLAPVELTALAERVQRILDRGTHAELPSGRYPLPWPLW